MDSIRDDVYQPLHAFLRRDKTALARLHPVLRLPAQIALLSYPHAVFAGLDYVLALAVKPANATAAS